MSKRDPNDPRGLIYESYHIDGINESECRSIFLDWALGLPGDVSEAIGELLARYGVAHPDHPMTAVLRAGLSPAGKPRRRGGWKSRDRS